MTAAIPVDFRPWEAAAARLGLLTQLIRPVDLSRVRHPVSRAGPVDGRWVAQDVDPGRFEPAECRHETEFGCPFGGPGADFWARESYCPDWGDYVLYKADDPTGRAARRAGYKREPRYRPSRHMPRRLSRFGGVVVAVRILRLRAITEEDAVAAGSRVPGDLIPRRLQASWSEREAFSKIWDASRGKRCPWGSNPFVWAVAFARLEGGI